MLMSFFGGLGFIEYVGEAGIRSVGEVVAEGLVLMAQDCKEN